MTETIKAIVKFKKETSIDENFLTALDATIEMNISSINAVTVEIDKKKLDKLKKNPNVEYVEVSTPEDAHALGFESEKKLTSKEISKIKSTQVVPWGISKIRAPEVHANGNKGTGIKVCIIDTGVYYNHPDLKVNYKGGWDFVRNNSDANDFYGHGTHVAGTVAAADNDIGVIGVAPEASIYSYRVLDENGSGSYANIVSAIDRAIDEKMQIISMSLGGSGYSQALKDVCDAANNAGIVVVAAAGNADGDGSQDTVGYPAKFASVIAVASTDSNDNRSSFSSCGPEVEVAAPGSAVLSTVPTSGTTISDPSGYMNLSGTSMATPHVSGLVALMLKAHPDWTVSTIRKQLDTTSVDLGTSGKDIFFGYGRIDAVNAVGETPVPTGYDCINGTCTLVTHENPQFPDLASCQAGCKPTPPPVLSSIKIPPSATVQIGNSVTLTATCSDNDGNVITCPSLTWTSDNSDVASVSNGVVTANTQGTANIVCSNLDGSVKSNTCAVTVTPKISAARFSVHRIGGLGVTVLKLPGSNFDANQACAEACKIIKSIDK